MLTFQIGLGRVNCLAFSPRGDCLAVGSGDRTIYLLHWPGGDIRWRLPAPNIRCVPRQVAFREDGLTLAAVFTDARTLEWETESGRLINQWLPQGWTNSTARPLGLWHSGNDLGWEWAYASWQEHAIAALGSSLEREIFPVGERPTWVWRIGDRELLGLKGKDLTRYRRQPEKIDATPSLWRQVVFTLFRPIIGSQAPSLIKESELKIPGHTARAATLWPDQSSMLLGGNRGLVRRVSRTTGQQIRNWGLPLNTIHSLAVSADSTVAAAGSNGGTILVWDLDD
jgi:WD40 repeat protein